MRSSPRDAATAVTPQPHTLERAVCRELQSHEALTFSSLVVRRLQDGVVCLEGVLEHDGSALPDIDMLVRGVVGVQDVLNHLVVQQPADGRSRTGRIRRTPR